MRPDEPVRMCWRDRDEVARAEGRAEDGHTILPRQDAEQLVHWLLRCPDERFDFSIDPWPPTSSPATSPPMMEMPVLWIAVLEFLASLWGFMSRHRSIFLAAGFALGIFLLAVLAIYLPAPHLRAYPVVAFGVTCGLTGFLLTKLPPPTL